MVQIILNDEQLAILHRASEPVRVVDRFGRDVGRLIVPPASSPGTDGTQDADVALALERMQAAERGDGKFYSAADIEEHLQSLEEA